LKRIEDYPHLRNYLRELYQIPPIKAATRLGEIRNHYYQSHRNINPYGIVALWDGNYDSPHNRQSLPGKKIPGDFKSVSPNPTGVYVGHHTHSDSHSPSQSHGLSESSSKKRKQGEAGDDSVCSLPTRVQKTS